MTLKPTACVASGIALLALCSPGANATPLSDSLDAALQGVLAETGTPGAAATVTSNGQTVWSGASGYANPAAGVPFQTSTLSSLASVTKLFTLTIVERLAEDGKLSLNSPITPYVPSYVPSASQVTIGELLNFTAGYADIEDLPAYHAAYKDPNHVWTRDELFQPITAPHFAPGSQFEYSNTDYLLLGAVIDSVYPGGTNAAFQSLIAGPAGLGQDVVWQRDPAVAARFAHGFETEGGQTTDVSAGALDLGVNTSVWGTLFTDGGIGATAEGVARFGDALYSGKLLDAADTAAQVYCGFNIDGHCWDGFVGAFNGYDAFLLHDSDRNVTVAAVSNGLNLDDQRQLAFIPALIGAYDSTADLATNVPEPASWAMLGLGVGVLGLWRRRQSLRRDVSWAVRPKGMVEASQHVRVW